LLAYIAAVDRGLPMNGSNIDEDSDSEAVKIISNCQRELRILRIMCTFILMIVLFDYLLDIDWLGSKTRSLSKG
jgi:hypothetical protein